MTAWRSRPLQEALGSRHIERRGRYAIAVLKKLLDVEPHPSSRLPEAVTLLERVNEIPAVLDRADGALLDRLSDAQRTIWDFFTIAYAADLRRERPGRLFPKQKVILALGGASIEAADTNHLHRNTQFELYVAAMLALGGAAVRFGEPDILIQVGSQECGVAAKRLVSLSQAKLEERMLDAAGQIARTGKHGYVAVNIDSHYRGSSLSSDEVVRQELFTEKTSRPLEIIRRKLGAMSHVEGALVYGYSSSWDTSKRPPHHSTSVPVSYQLIGGDNDRTTRPLVHSFWEGYIARLHNQLDYMRSVTFQGV